MLYLPAKVLSPSFTPLLDSSWLYCALRASRADSGYVGESNPGAEPANQGAEIEAGGLRTTPSAPESSGKTRMAGLPVAL